MTNAPVGPPIWTREPPMAETIAPPMIAVNRPRSGFTPEAMAKAIESGSAIVATLRPASRSRRNWSLVRPEKRPSRAVRTEEMKFMGFRD